MDVNAVVSRPDLAIPAMMYHNFSLLSVIHKLERLQVWNIYTILTNSLLVTSDDGLMFFFNKENQCILYMAAVTVQRQQQLCCIGNRHMKLVSY